MNPKQYLNKLVTVQIERSLGSLHPDKGFLYERNYGFIPNTISGDGEELDAYILCIDTPLVGEYVGRCIAIIRRLDEDDDKLVVVPDGFDLDDDMIEQELFFREGKSPHKIIR